MVHGSGQPHIVHGTRLLPRWSLLSFPCSHVLDHISPIFPPFFPVFCAFSPPRRDGSNEPQARTQGQETAARGPRGENSFVRRDSAWRHTCGCASMIASTTPSGALFTSARCSGSLSGIPLSCSSFSAQACAHADHEPPIQLPMD